MEQYTDIEFELNDDVDVVEDLDLKFNSYEDVEINIGGFIENDVGADDLQLINHNLSIISEIPELRFVSESDISKVATWQGTPHGAEVENKCLRCGKNYMRRSFFEKHVAQCMKSMRKKVEGSKDTSLSTKEMASSKFKTKKSNKKDIWKVKQIDTVECQQLVIDIINLVITDPCNIMTVGNYRSPGNRLKAFCEEIFLYRDTDSFRDSCVAMCQFLLETLHNNDVSREIGKEEMWSDIHLKLCNGDMDHFWSNFLQLHMPAFEPSSLEFKICIQTLAMGTTEFIIKKENAERNQEIKLENVPLSNHEQEVIYHIGGFIVYSLKKKYLQLSKSEKLRQAALAAVQLLNSFTFVETNQTLSFLDFSHRWTSLISRGGLIKTNNNYFLFIRRIEEIVRRTLNVHFIKKYNGEDLRDIIVKQLQESSLLTSNWEVLSRMLPSESLASQIKSKTFYKCVDIRARSYVQCFMQILKRNIALKKITGKNVAIIGEPSMRKTLK